MVQSDVAEPGDAPDRVSRGADGMLGADEAMVLDTVAREVLSASDSGELTRVLVRDIHRMLELRSCNVWLIDPDARMLVQVAQEGFAHPPGPVPIDRNSDLGTSLLERRAVVRENSGDPTTPPTTRAILAMLGPESKSLVVMPLWVESEPIGALICVWPTPRTFEARELQLLQTIAALLALGVRTTELRDELTTATGSEGPREADTRRVELLLENARLLEAERAALERERTELESTQMLLDAMRSLEARFDLQTVLERLAEIALRFTGATRAFVNVIDSQRQVLIPMVPPGGLAAPHGPEIPFERLSATSRQCIEAAETAVLDYERPDIADYDRQIAEANRSRVVLFVPLAVHGNLVGHISLDVPGERHDFTPREIEMVEAIAGQAALVVRNAWLYEDARAARKAEARRAERMTLLRELSDVTLTAQSVSDAARRAAGIVSRGLDLSSAAILESDATDTALVPVATLGFDPDIRLSPVRLESDDLAAAVYRTQRAVFIGDVEEDDTLTARARQFARSMGICASATFPLIVRGRPLGVFVATWEQPHAFDADETSFLQAVASQVALGLQNARLFDEVQRHADLEWVLARAGAALASSLDVFEVLPDVLRSAGRILGAEGVALTQREGSGWRTASATGIPDEVVGIWYADQAVPLLTEVAQRRTLHFVVDVPSSPRIHKERAACIGHTSYAAFPVLHRSEVTAALEFFWRHQRDALSEDESDFISRLTFIVGLAMANSKLYQAEHDLAETLQEALLSLPDSVDGVDFAYAYRSSSVAARVGGDFYDVFEIDDHRIGITIGDVAGKGVDAAILTSLVKHTVRAYCVEPEHGPGRVLELANELVARSTPVESFATVFLGVYDRERCVLEFANAGHTTSAVVRADGVEPLGGTGPILGAFAQVTYEQRAIPLANRDMLFLYTDGLTEARRGSDQYGEERLFELLETVAGRPVATVVERSIADVLAYAEGRLRDDLAILVVVPTPDGG